MAESRTDRYQSLDIWRGVACLMIVVIHSSYYLLGHPDQLGEGVPAKAVEFFLPYFLLGVPIFFVISGYCITATSLSSARNSRPLKTYFLRRFRRIYPPYWIALALMAALVVGIYQITPELLSDSPHPVEHPSSLSRIQWLTNLTLTEIFRHHFIPGERVFFLMQAWSLCYEEQFYAICGLVIWKWPSRYFRVMVWLSAITLVPAALFFTKLNLPVEGFFFDGLWLLFAAGILVYYQVNHASVEQVWLIRLALVAFILGAAGLRFVYHLPGAMFVESGVNKVRAMQYLAGFGFALVLSFLHSKDSEISRNRLLWPLNFCGQMCYSLYLIHWPITKIVSHLLFQVGIKGLTQTLLIVIPSCITASVAVAWVFYQLVEKRFLNRPQSVGRLSSAQTGDSKPQAVLTA
ncbi:MAG: acyltransferase [Acidobacteria bacterium]|nr:acyltransferase [Acidobacteriota bacterium]